MRNERLCSGAPHSMLGCSPCTDHGVLRDACRTDAEGERERERERETDLETETETGTETETEAETKAETDTGTGTETGTGIGTETETETETDGQSDRAREPLRDRETEIERGRHASRWCMLVIAPTLMPPRF